MIPRTLFDVRGFSYAGKTLISGSGFWLYNRIKGNKSIITVNCQNDMSAFSVLKAPSGLLRRGGLGAVADGRLKGGLSLPQDHNNLNLRLPSGN